MDTLKVDRAKSPLNNSSTYTPVIRRGNTLEYEGSFDLGNSNVHRPSTPLDCFSKINSIRLQTESPHNAPHDTDSVNSAAIDAIVTNIRADN